MPDITDPSEQRRLLALSFEPDGDQFVFFRNRWSPGVSVTAAERESYLSEGLFGRRTFVREMTGRPPVLPPRKTDGGLRWQMLRAFPVTMIVGYVLGGFFLLSIAAGQRTWVWQWVFVAAAALSLGMAVAIIAAKQRRLPRKS